ASSKFEGPDAGKGAKFSWAGNSDVGKGSMTIVDSAPAERIGIRLDFIEPMEGTSDVRFTFRPNGEKTDVTWAMSGHASFIEKAICLVFFDRDKMVGGMFEKGLSNLDAATRTAAPVSRVLQGETECM
ncbi:MAG: SRPBCC family protein, partial [Pseudomonadota bacterium]|nr:SRPBCC family protein [Pseudomonadota bacterium]